MPVYLIATLDTKGDEAEFVRSRLVALGVPTVLMDAGCLGTSSVAPGIPRDAVFEAAGAALADVQAANDRGRAVTLAATGAANIVRATYDHGDLSGVIAIGGSAGTTIGTTAMRALPLGVPKLCVSTVAAGNMRPYVGGKDVMTMYSVVDIAGLNRISRTVLDQAARAMAGMVALPKAPAVSTDRPLVAATMFGVTTPCVQHARGILEAAGYEVLVFHATGSGGEAMESLIADGLIAGVLDITTTELADELVGGVLTAGPTRLTAAGKRGVPQVISVGALDMVNFGPPETVPTQFRDRLLYRHNPTITLMRTTVAENRALGEEIGRKAAAATGPTAILLPKQGVSAIDKTGQPFNDPSSRDALFAGIRSSRGSVAVTELNNHINDADFAAACAQRLLVMLAKSQGGPSLRVPPATNFSDHSQ
ncbi:MAG: Tm-1-like ATP-binding domain-containing protein [Planctomycetaceae bacterium]|nr:Tm-1-like ATP-binding domain-containing protein [Planctomycetaceae bacterium]